MSKLEELINKLCPNGVEFKKIEGITKSVNIGINPRKFFKLNPDDAIGFYVTVRELNGLKGVNQTEKTDLINDEAIKIIQARANIENGDILFSNTGTVGKMALVDYETLNWGVNEGIYIIKPKHEIINSKFLYYYLDSNLAYADYSRMLTGSTMKHITQKALLSISVPVPPLEVQCEIVRILDNFTLLSAELSAELSARQKQYEYYRNKLFNFDETISKKLLSEICNLSAGGDIDKKNVVKEKTERFDIPVYSNGIGENALYGYTNVYRIAAPALTISGRGTIGYCELRKENFYPIVRLICVKPKSEEINIEYLKYYIDTITFKVPTTGIPQLTVPMISNYMIPVPPKEKQEEIARILNKFDKLCNDISEGLPAEIEARKKQYEYYRDKLLTFKELKS